MQICPNTKMSCYYISMLTHDIRSWFNTQMIGTICEQFPHLDPQSGAWRYLRHPYLHAP